MMLFEICFVFHSIIFHITINTAISWQHDSIVWNNCFWDHNYQLCLLILKRSVSQNMISVSDACSEHHSSKKHASQILCIEKALQTTTTSHSSQMFGKRVTPWYRYKMYDSWNVLPVLTGWFRCDAKWDNSTVRGAADGTRQVPGRPEGHKLSGQQGVRPGEGQWLNHIDTCKSHLMSSQLNHSSSF